MRVKINKIFIIIPNIQLHVIAKELEAKIFHQEIITKKIVSINKIYIS